MPATIYRASWGYDQTNIDYYEVVSRTAKTVQLRPIAKRLVRATGDMSELVEPIPGKYIGSAFRRKVHTEHRDAVQIDSVSAAYPWDGTPDHQTHWA